MGLSPGLPWEWEFLWEWEFPWEWDGNGNRIYPMGIPTDFPMGILKFLMDSHVGILRVFPWEFHGFVIYFIWKDHITYPIGFGILIGFPRGNSHVKTHRIPTWEFPWEFPRKPCGNGMGMGIEIPFPRQPWLSHLHTSLPLEALRNVSTAPITQRQSE